MLAVFYCLLERNRCLSDCFDPGARAPAIRQAAAAVRAYWLVGWAGLAARSWLRA